jgi:hypothetical protein
MRDGVPFGNERQELSLQVGRRRTIHDPQPLALEERAPWLDLVQPGTMDRREGDHETWVRRQPGSDVLARMRPGVIADEMNGLDGRRNLGGEVRQEGDELALPLACVTLPIHPPCPRVEGGEEIKSPHTPILVFHQHGATRLRGPCGVAPWPGWQGGLLIHAEDHVLRTQQTRGQVHHRSPPRIELGVPRCVGREPQMVLPGLELMGGEEATDGLGRDVLDDALTLQLSRQLQAIPLGEGPAEGIRPFTGQLDQMPRYRRGKRPAGGPGRVYPPALRAAG